MVHPYVVSSDLETLWSRNGIVLPKNALADFRHEVSNCLRTIFGVCEWIPEAELREGIEHLLRGSDLPIVSLDKDVYAHDQEFHIDATRLHNMLGDFLGCGSRNGGVLGTLEHQVRDLAKSIGKEIALVDDVLFSGELMKKLVELFEACGVTIRIIYAGVAIGEGIHKVEPSRLRG